jgi:FtsZ-interacting cell division protein YlmF
MTVGNGELVTARDLTFGNRGIIFFEPKYYPTIKKIFDQIQARDTHTISLKANGDAEAKGN